MMFVRHFPKLIPVREFFTLWMPEKSVIEFKSGGSSWAPVADKGRELTSKASAVFVEEATLARKYSIPSARWSTFLLM